MSCGPGGRLSSKYRAVSLTLTLFLILLRRVSMTPALSLSHSLSVVRRSSQAICIFSSSKVIMAFCTPPPPHTQTHKHMQRYTHQVINNNTDDNDDSLESIPLFCMLVTDAGLFMLKGGLRNRSLKKLVYLLTSLTDLCVLQALYVFYGNDNCMNEII